MLTRVFKVLVLFIALIGTGCAIGLGKSVHEFSMNEAIDVSTAKKARPIELIQDQNVIIGTFDTDYVDVAHQKLLAQCERGQIVNIRTRYSTDLGFFAYKNILKINATCLE